MKLADIKDHSWHVIVARIENGEHPPKHHLIIALRRGETVPPQAQSYIADLLEGRLKRRGRPKGSQKKRSDNDLLLLLIEMDDLVERYKEAGSNKRVQSAREALASEYDLEPDSLEVYLKQARKLTQIPDAALALNVDEERQRLKLEGVADPLNSALELVARKWGLSIGITRGRYERGKRWVRKHCEDSPEFK
jgi:hypothetical protein